MQEYRVKATIDSDGSLTIKHLPLPVGESVEVIILVQDRSSSLKDSYPLQGKKIIYRDPFDSVAENDWDVIE